jgi:hypothetical protein
MKPCLSYCAVMAALLVLGVTVPRESFNQGLCIVGLLLVATAGMIAWVCRR